MGTIKKDWEFVRNSMETSLKKGLAEIVEGGIADLDGPIREAANRLTVAARRKRQDLVDEARDTLALAMMEQEIRAKAGFEGILDFALGAGINLLVDGAIAGLGALSVTN
jgi:hypothetical protein